MGGSSSKDVVTLWVRVKVQTAENFSYSTQPAADQRSVVGTEKMLELELPGRTTIQEVKEILYHQHNVFPGLSIAQWTLAITGMDGTPKMFAYPAKDNVPDVNAYLYETGIIEAAECTAYVPDDDE